MKRWIALLLTPVLMLGCTACGITEKSGPIVDRIDGIVSGIGGIGDGIGNIIDGIDDIGNGIDSIGDNLLKDPDSTNKQDPSNKQEDILKVGFIFRGDATSVYDKNFIDAAIAACEEAGVVMVQKHLVAETNAAHDAAVNLIEEHDCDVIFANSFGHEPYMITAAREYPEVDFCIASGDQAHTAGLRNVHNAFAAIYEGRYLAGVVAGMKLNAMIENGEITATQAKMGFVGTYTYAEVISGYTAFYLGAKSVCPSVTMDVTFSGSWHDTERETAKAQALINGGCVLLSQHSEYLDVPNVCERNGVPNVACNGAAASACPNTFLVASRINWKPYFEYMIEQAQANGEIATDWTGTLGTGSVELTDLGTACAPGTAQKVEEVKERLISRSLDVFNTANFTVNGSPLVSYMGDVDVDPAYVADTQCIMNGVFRESMYRSAPYFDIEIDGITLLDRYY